MSFATARSAATSVERGAKPSVMRKGFFPPPSFASCLVEIFTANLSTEARRDGLLDASACCVRSIQDIRIVALNEAGLEVHLPLVRRIVLRVGDPICHLLARRLDHLGAVLARLPHQLHPCAHDELPTEGVLGHVAENPSSDLATFGVGPRFDKLHHHGDHAYLCQLNAVVAQRQKAADLGHRDLQARALALMRALGGIGRGSLVSKEPWRPERSIGERIPQHCSTLQQQER